MDFDVIEKLSPEEIEELYGNVAEKDNLACNCNLRGYVMLNETLHAGVAYFNWSSSYCDAPENQSNAACFQWCDDNFIGEPSDWIGRITDVYTTDTLTFGSGHLHSWDGTKGININYATCRIPDDAECSGNGWTRWSGANGIYTYYVNFRYHCSN